MIKFLNSLGVGSIVYAAYLGISLVFPTNLPKDVVIKTPMVVKENKKLLPPKEAPKMFDQKRISKMEMIDYSDTVIENHIISILEKNRYGCMGKSRNSYASDFASSVLSNTNGNIELALWITAMAQIESSYRLTADPRVSSARGYLQVIYKYHSRELAKAGISKDDLSSNPAKSVLAGIIVFRKYLVIEHGDYKAALRRYRGLSVPEAEQIRYYKAITKVYNHLLNNLKEYA